MTTKSGTPRDDWSIPILLLFLLPAVGGGLALTLPRELRANLVYVEGRCVVLDKRVVEDPSRRKAVNSTYRPEFLIRYTAGGREHLVWAYTADRSSSALRWPKERVLERFTVGQEYPCWYDPADPSQVVLVRGYSGWTYGVLVVFVVLAFFAGKSVLRRLRNARRAAGEASGAVAEPGQTAGCT